MSCPQSASTRHAATRALLFATLEQQADWRYPAQDALFPRVSVSECVDIASSGNVGRLLSSAPALAIQNLFTSNGLRAQVGFNMGSGQLSVTIHLPTAEEQAVGPLLSPAAAVLWGMLRLLPDYSLLEHDYKTAVRAGSLSLSFSSPSLLSPAAAAEAEAAALDALTFFSSSAPSSVPAAATPAALAALPAHAETGVSRRWLAEEYCRIAAVIEDLLGEPYAAATPATTACSRSSTADSPAVEHGPTPLLANRCLYLFARSTHSLPTSFRSDPLQRTLTLILTPFRRQSARVRHARSGAAPRLAFLLPRRQVLHDLGLIDAWEIAPPARAPAAADLAAAAAAAAAAGLGSIAAAAAGGEGAGAGADGDIAYRRGLFASPYVISDEDGEDGIRYGPLASVLTGAAPAPAGGCDWTTPALELQQALAASLLLRGFWRHSTARLRYFPSRALVAQVSPVVAAYAAAGVSSPREAFLPRAPLHVYLWGTAGTGKSTFVRVFTDGLRHLIAGAFAPDTRVEATRVPLNQTSPAALAAMLSVRGISDWSVERIVEQTLCKGGLSLLHLEELPPAPEAQEALYALTSRMAAGLAARYPENRHNIVHISTANYPPAPALAAESATVVIYPPAAREQRLWAARTLEDVVAGSSAAVAAGMWGSVLAGGSCAQFAEAAAAQPPCLWGYPGEGPYVPEAANSAPAPLRVPAAPASTSTTTNSNNTSATSVAAAGAGAVPLLPLSTTTPLPTSFPLPGLTADSPAAAESARLRQSSYLRFRVAFTFAASPPQTRDMRRLDAWKRTLGFGVLEHCYRNAHTLARADAAATAAVGGKAAAAVATTFALRATVTSVASAAGAAGAASRSPAAALSRAAIDGDDKEEEEQVAEVAPLGDLIITFTRLYPGHTHDAALRAAAGVSSTFPGAAAVLSEVLPPLRMRTDDGFFFYPILSATSSPATLSPPRPLALPLAAFPATAAPRLAALLRTWVSNFLRPSVLVLTGPRRSVTAAAAEVRRVVHATVARPVAAEGRGRRLGQSEVLTLRSAAAILGDSDGPAALTSNIRRAAAGKATRGVLGAQAGAGAGARAGSGGGQGQGQGQGQRQDHDCGPFALARAELAAAVTTATAASRPSSGSNSSSSSSQCHSQREAGVTCGIPMHLPGPVAVAAAFPDPADGAAAAAAAGVEGGEPLLCPSEVALAFFSGAALGVPPFLPLSTGVVSPSPSTAQTKGHSQGARKGAAGMPALHEFFAVAMDEGDRRVLFGDPDPATGALLGFLRGLNAAAASVTDSGEAGAGAAAEKGGAVGVPPVGVVYVHASAQGQFMLRELLDAGDSLTHVTDVKKDRLLFVVCVAAEDRDLAAAAGDTAGGRKDGVQPQVVSRAHDVVACVAENGDGDLVGVELRALL